ncbi:DUF4118 domain-containing protein [Celerinatantimonas diazotrophica]|uniref:histidine kinase n=1 Tax=Celerinatantimonas diazotrophica TaxID=412034 RepID=A0A4V2PR77_9GAMM|nr:DUF4118 domain-containing protein [Celerinatantimonas diazotrophica]TCK57761.1 two-component system sensor histidine kinase KdpD [Celerinatantimonas diazotrophica]CAG9298177.1 Sensor protein KdpD [Celerinatantimonas diazotrophica]
MQNQNRADALLKKLELEQNQASSRGRLKIFLGAAAGVGKTYAMLHEAHQLFLQGTDVLIGIVETHGRSETQKMANLLPMQACQLIYYKGQRYNELDLDSILQRKPALILVDEFAHTNVPGSRHEKRFQDVKELLDAGIDVYTTLNVQHLGSLNDLVYQLTHVRVQEIVPDELVLNADTILLVDLPPQQLIQRLREGKIYLPVQAQAALQAFFSASNLTALRELAIQTVASHVQGEMNLYQATQGKAYVALQDKVMVCIDGQSASRQLIRIAQRVALRQQIPWIVLYVSTGEHLSEFIEETLAFATDLGARVITVIDPHIGETIVRLARQQSVSQVIIGRTKRRHFLRISLIGYLQRHLGDIELTLSRVNSRSEEKKRKNTLGIWQFDKVASQLGICLFGIVLTTGVGLIISPWLPASATLLLFILTVLLCALITRPAMATLSAVLSFIACNFFFTQPMYTFKVSDNGDLLSLFVLLVVGLVVGRLAAHHQQQLRALRKSQHITQMLLNLSQTLSASNNLQDIAQHVQRIIGQALDCHVVIFDSQQQTPLIEASVEIGITEQAAIHWSLKHQQLAGCFTDTLNGSRFQFHPLNKTLVIGLALTTPLSFTIQHQLNSMLSDVRAAIDRVTLTDQLQKISFEAETNRIRAAILSSVSHDLKTPLSAIIGSATTFLNYQFQLESAEQKELIQGIHQEAQRLTRYIQNLLDMIRLGENDFQLKRDVFSIETACQNVMKRLHSQIEGRSVQLTLDTKVKLLFANQQFIEQVLTNLLDNAIRYSPSDQPILIQTLYSPPDFIIDVIDQGTGLSDLERTRIFELFYTHPVGDSGNRGTGLGLAISRAMIEAHGGKIWSFPGQYGNGNYMRISLPLDQNTQESA